MYILGVKYFVASPLLDKRFNTVWFLQEDYVEYSRTGSVIKGAERAKVKSMYEEDVYINNHSVGGAVYHLFYGNRETALQLLVYCHYV